MNPLQMLSFAPGRTRRPLVALLALAAILGACGENAWDGLTGPGFGGDGEAPEVEVRSPNTGQTFAVGDPLRVEVHVRDNRGVEQVEISGYSLRGSARLGTQQKVERFETKVVDLSLLERAVRDTSLVRDLIATGDTVPEDTVYIVAVARDSVGNVRRDSTTVSLGGSRVRIIAPVPEKQVPAGSTLDASVLVMDARHPVRQVRLYVRRTADAQRPDSVVHTLSPARDSVVREMEYPVPADYTGPLYIQAAALNAANVVSMSPTVVVRVTPPTSDEVRPVVQFSVVAPPRAEPWDTVTVRVSATDNGQRLSRIGATVVARRATDGTLLARLTRDSTSGAASGEFRFVLHELGVPLRVDSTFSVNLEINGFAVDTAQARNCAAAISPGREQSLGCINEPSLPAGGQAAVLADAAGALSRVLGVRGRTAAPAESGSRLADLAADSTHRRVFASNFSKNRVEVLPFDAGRFSGSVAVGSEPWGVAVGKGRDTLYVANSGGTNISVIPLTPSVPVERSRIRTPDVRLWGFDYDVEKDSVNSVIEYDYSDRPQFLGQLASGELMYSTKPTRARADGTVRTLDFDKYQAQEFGRVTEILTNYAVKDAGKGIVVNALSAGLDAGKTMEVCPRRRLPTQTEDPQCMSATARVVASYVQQLRDAGLTDTRVVLGRDIRSIGLTDTTFVAVSRDNSTIVFGEGATAPNPGRIFLYRTDADTLVGSTTETADLVGNAAERVIGVGLNGDGSFGVARGSQVYFYEDDLRLQGVVPSGSPTGGSVLHPMNSNYPAGGMLRAFTSGVEPDGRPYIDVVDTYTFRLLRRIYIRDPVVGTLIAVPVGEGDPLSSSADVRLFGITAKGVLQLDVTLTDLQ